MCRLYLHSQIRHGAETRVRGSHDFHRVILDFKKESPGSVLLLSRAEYSAAG